MSGPDEIAADVQATMRELREDYARRYRATSTELVEAGRVRDYLLALDEPAQRNDDEPVPALFLLTLGRSRRPQPSRGSAVNAGDEIEFHSPVYVGDRITVRRELKDIEHKDGRRGSMFLLTSEITYTNQDDRLVAVGRQRSMRWGL